MELSSMVSLLTSEKVLERMHCTESEKAEIMKTIDLLCEMTETARQEGYSVLHEKYRDSLDKLIKGTNGIYLKVLLKSYLGILSLS